MVTNPTEAKSFRWHAPRASANEGEVIQFPKLAKREGPRASASNRFIIPLLIIACAISVLAIVGFILWNWCYSRD